MRRRVLHLVLLFAVVLSTTAAQAQLMPCCYTEPGKTEPGKASSSLQTSPTDSSATSCHGMSPADLASMPQPHNGISAALCAARTCPVAVEFVATAVAQDKATVPFTAVSATLSFGAALPAGQAGHGILPQAQSHTPHGIAAPLRV